MRQTIGVVLRNEIVGFGDVREVPRRKRGELPEEPLASFLIHGERIQDALARTRRRRSTKSGAGSSYTGSGFGCGCRTFSGLSARRSAPSR